MSYASSIRKAQYNKEWRLRNPRYRIYKNRREKERYWKNPLVKADKSRVRLRETKKKIVRLYGNKCVMCGFSDIRALQLDHKFGVPKEDRGTGLRGGCGLYSAILRGIKPKDDFQLLCANCNTIKRMENREHTPRMRV